MKKLDLSYLAFLDKNSSYRWTVAIYSNPSTNRCLRIYLQMDLNRQHSKEDFIEIYLESSVVGQILEVELIFLEPMQTLHNQSPFQLKKEMNFYKLVSTQLLVKLLKLFENIGILSLQVIVKEGIILVSDPITS